MSRLEHHLRGIARHGADLAERLRRVDPVPQVRIFPARSGVLTAEVPSAENGLHPRLLHSRIDPQREAERLVNSIEPRGFIVCMGMGLGYHVARLLQHDAVTTILVVDYDLAMVRTLLERWPHDALFHDARLHLAVDESPADLARTVGSRYVPMVHGDLRVLSLRGRVDADPARFADAVHAVRGAIDASIGDFSVQQLFGRRWMRNMVINLVHPGLPAPRLPRLDQVVVTAAGPSLDDHLDSLSRPTRTETVVATDSSLSVLAAAGILPAMTVAVDAQQISYLHAMGASDSLGTLVADLGVPPVIARRFRAVHWVAGDHPLVALLRSRGVAVPYLNTGDGSVTHTAVRIARTLGARQVSVVGADFGYPRAGAYARGCYLPVHAVQHGSRLKPAHSRLYRFVLDRPGVRCDKGEAGFRYTTPVLQQYRTRLADALQSDQEPLRDSEAGPSWTPAHARAVLLGYADQLHAMAAPAEPLWRALSALNSDEQNLWRTLFPLAAYYHRSGGSGMPPADTVNRESLPHPLEQARREAVRMIRQLVE